MIKIQTEDFDVGYEYLRLRKGADNSSGAIVTFCGLVRDLEKNNSITALHLEHYPGMTEKALKDIAAEANTRWPLNAISIIHRIGELKTNDQIVFVGVASAHRTAAFEASEFLMDYLKTKAPFWKKAIMGPNSEWIEAKESDDSAAKRWGIS
ncbi:MAG: molybdopterin synthase catalytic subunit MoaE [Cellvibrionaceae bacterium]